ncbi:RDD family protein [Corynebacterium endometrii]|uniref:RDD family protein n=1 Tax=Corynebacterium endometrii TaxID=2488819 RepID=A0A4P7QGG1_9CORY|nr:RDD family protein [Corynebacterium endometrii]QCB28852.1 RDD family protein [Corynebacterium endometrii]
MADKRTWLDGPGIPGEFDDPDAPGKWPGEKLGLPQSGSGSMASVGRRAMAVALDWIICLALALVITRFTMQLGDVSTVTLILWVVVGIIGGWLFARTPGMAILGLGVARVDIAGARVGLWRAVVRTLLTSTVFPAAMVDADGRGLHDRGTGTAVIHV